MILRRPPVELRCCGDSMKSGNFAPVLDHHWAYTLIVGSFKILARCKAVLVCASGAKGTRVPESKLLREGRGRLGSRRDGDDTQVSGGGGVEGEACAGTRQCTEAGGASGSLHEEDGDLVFVDGEKEQSRGLAV